MFSGRSMRLDRDGLCFASFLFALHAVYSSMRFGEPDAVRRQLWNRKRPSISST